MPLAVVLVLASLLLTIQGSDSVSDDQPLTIEESYLQMAEMLLKRHHEKLMRTLDQISLSDAGPAVWVGPFAPAIDNDQDVLQPLESPSNTNFTSVPRKKDFPTHLPLPHHINYPIHLNHRLIRSRGELSEEICKTHRYWKQINETLDIYGREVIVAHTAQYRQFAFVYECIGEGQTCSGVSTQVQSACEMRPGWANMLHRKKESPQSAPQWGYVAVPHHCGCRIYPRIGPLV